LEIGHANAGLLKLDPTVFARRLGAITRCVTYVTVRCEHSLLGKSREDGSNPRRFLAALEPPLLKIVSDMNGNR
jgi:hypothetical protein